MNPNAPLNVLVLCTGNSARSIIGEYLLRIKGKGRFEVHSAGAKPTGKVNPLALWVLKERFKIDASDARSKSWDELKHIQFDCVITVCDHAKESCPVWPGKPILAHWSSPDPASVNGTEEQKKRAFVEVALQIGRRVDLLCALPPHQFEQFRVQEIGEQAKIEGDPNMTS
ncbi:MAG: arsenate reductase ArsC [Opitutaceae bacterium]